MPSKERLGWSPRRFLCITAGEETVLGKCCGPGGNSQHCQPITGGEGRAPSHDESPNPTLSCTQCWQVFNNVLILIIIKYIIMYSVIGNERRNWPLQQQQNMHSFQVYAYHSSL